MLALTGAALSIRARHAWTKGTSLRLRSLALADTDGDGAQEIVAGGQYDADGKPCLGSSPSITAGEVKDILAVGAGAELRVLVTGAAGTREDSLGDLAAWRGVRGHLVRDADLVSRNGDPTRARAVVAVPGGACSRSGTRSTRARWSARCCAGSSRGRRRCSGALARGPHS